MTKLEVLKLLRELIVGTDHNVGGNDEWDGCNLVDQEELLWNIERTIELEKGLIDETNT